MIIIFVLFVVLTRFLFRRSFAFHPDRVDAVLALQERRAITDPRLLARCLVVLAFVVAGFALHSVLHLEPSIVALVGAGVMMLIARVDVDDVLREVEWPPLVFFMGLFIMVAATMAPIVEELVAQVPDPATGQALWWSFALGADFGGNGTAVGESCGLVGESCVSVGESCVLVARRSSRRS